MRVWKMLVIVFCSITFIFWTNMALAGPTGAKALFDSGEGPSEVSSVSKKTKPEQEQTVAKEKYVGISYQLMLVSSDGQVKPVSKSRVFKNGERLKILVRTNRPGYLCIMNIGPTGNTHVLFNEYVNALEFIEIPKGTNLVFTGNPGTEKLLVMLSDDPNPMFNKEKKETVTASSTPAPNTSSSYPAVSSPPPPPSSDAQGSSLPPPPPPSTLVAQIEGQKGAKDIVVEDTMQSSYAVISPKTGYKPVKSGMKDIVLESTGGVNYGVVPVSALSNGGILTLQINLKHK